MSVGRCRAPLSLSVLQSAHDVQLSSMDESQIARLSPSIFKRELIAPVALSYGLSFC